MNLKRQHVSEEKATQQIETKRQTNQHVLAFCMRNSLDNYFQST